MKTTCRKSWPGNLFQVLNLTFDPCFKVKWGRHTKMSFFFSLIIGAMALEYKDRPSKVLTFTVLPEKNFGLTLKNKMASMANYLKIIKML